MTGIGKWVRPIAFWAATTAAASAEPEAVKIYGSEEVRDEIVVRSTTDIELLEPLLRAFAASAPQSRVRYEQWNSNPLYADAARACRTGSNAADLVISSAVDQQVKLVNDGCAQPHWPLVDEPGTGPVANWRNEVFGITVEPAVIVYNSDFVTIDEAPMSRFDIIDLLRPAGSRFAGRVATYDIQASGLGYLFAFLDSQQATTFGSMIEAFARAGAIATCCSAEIIDGVADGRYLIAYNVLGSYALNRAETADNLVVVAPSDYTLILRRAALIPKDAGNPAGAAQLLDFILSSEGRRLLAETHLFVDVGNAEEGDVDVPLATGAALREIPLSPVLLVGLDRQKRAAFIDLWRSTFRRD
ncbi:ABC transporter substrate-binding protein [Tropicimonas aquimaris]|uniref:ABC transporter substrate-binding protein n=1 Tax=Tropicimonas aquimaris TaxID=914152 RepID=A0ABW3ILX0_9RHOB